MARFAKHIGLLILSVLIVMIILDKLYSYTFKNSAPRSKIQKILQLGESHYDLIFLGSSRTENHVDCAVIERITGKSCINFGISGGSIGDMVILMRLMETRNVTFEKAFLQLDYNYNSQGLSQNFKARLMPFIHEPTVKKELNAVGVHWTESNISFYRFMKYDQVIGFREFISSVINKKPKTDLNVGFAPKIGVGEAIATSFPEKFKEVNTEIQALEAIIGSQDKEIHYFTAPYCNKVQGRDAGIQQLKNRVENLHDYIGIYDDKPEYFFNCGHLNLDGARDFSRILAKKLIQPQF